MCAEGAGCGSVDGRRMGEFQGMGRKPEEGEGGRPDGEIVVPGGIWGVVAWAERDRERTDRRRNLGLCVAMAVAS